MCSLPNQAISQHSLRNEDVHSNPESSFAFLRENIRSCTHHYAVYVEGPTATLDLQVGELRVIEEARDALSQATHIVIMSMEYDE